MSKYIEYEPELRGRSEAKSPGIEERRWVPIMIRLAGGDSWKPVFRWREVAEQQAVDAASLERNLLQAALLSLLPMPRARRDASPYTSLDLARAYTDRQLVTKLQSRTPCLGQSGPKVRKAASDLTRTGSSLGGGFLTACRSWVQYQQRGAAAFEIRCHPKCIPK